MRRSYLFTSESVSEGHPDKVCDRISDEIVDLFFREGPKAGIDPWAIRAACETLATTNKVVIAGETRGPKSVTKEQIESVVREAIKDIGYEQEGFHWNTCDIEILLHPQSADIAQGVDALQPGTNKGEGAGPGLQEPGHRAIREWQAGRGARDRGFASASGRGHVLKPGPRPCRALCAGGAAQGLDQRQDHLAYQSHRQILHRRSRRRHRSYRPQDHRRYLWRRGPPRRRRVFRQGPDQGRPLGGLCRALSRQEYRRRRFRQPLHAAARLRDR